MRKALAAAIVRASIRDAMRAGAWVLAWIAAAAAGACAQRIPRPAFVAQPTSALVEVSEPPPPARVEVLPPKPASTAVWIDGEWMWRRGRWAWLAGRWCNPPPGAAFSPWVFERSADGRLWYTPGVWRTAAGEAIEAPPALAYASVQTAAVIDADGTVDVTGPTLRERPGQNQGPTGGP
jgi:hypothetical protein